MQLPVPLRRLTYRCGYRVLQVIWFFWRPQMQGVKCLLTADDRVLLVRHTYGRRSWDVPGGAVKRGEPPLNAAGREMSEELSLRPTAWIAIGVLRGRIDHRHDTIHCFRAEVAPDEKLSIDHGELETAVWFARSELPADLSQFVIPIVEHAPVLASRT